MFSCKASDSGELACEACRLALAKQQEILGLKQSLISLFRLHRVFVVFSMDYRMFGLLTVSELNPVEMYPLTTLLVFVHSEKCFALRNR